jgi:AcrR family transcriptional regulator
LQPYTDDVIHSSSPLASPGLRADAERNRLRNLTAAQALFGEQGLDVPLEDIARRAGVGIATLYRRFPTRAELVAATFENKMADYIAKLDQALENPDPWAGFCELIHNLCALQSADAGLKELLTLSFPRSPAVDELEVQSLAKLTRLIQAAQQHGGLRPDFDPSDVLLLLLANAGVITATARTAPDAWRRFAAYLIDAFRAEQFQDDPRRPLPAPTPEDQLRRSLHNRGLVEPAD